MTKNDKEHERREELPVSKSIHLENNIRMDRELKENEMESSSGGPIDNVKPIQKKKIITSGVHFTFFNED